MAFTARFSGLRFFFIALWVSLRTIAFISPIIERGRTDNGNVHSSTLAVALVAVWYLVAEGELAALGMGSKGEPYLEFETVSGIFLQSQQGTEAADFDNTKTNFGLINRTYPTDSSKDSTTAELSQWQRLDRYIQHLNAESLDSVSYKLLYMGRHGEGDHNVAEAFYGTEAWDDHWSKLDGNGSVNWVDAHLTPTGKEQALAAHAFLESQFTQQAMPVPDIYYVSPLYRCLQTAQLTFDGLTLPLDRPFAPTIKELLREVLGEHTCDRRSSRSVIHDFVPAWTIEEGFTEEDELWEADHRETHAEHDARTRAFLKDIFAASGEKTYLSLTSHSGAIASHLRVLGHRVFRLQTGGLIPVLVKATMIT